MAQPPPAIDGMGHYRGTNAAHLHRREQPCPPTPATATVPHELIVRDRAIISDLVALSVARDRDGGWSDDVVDIFTNPREVADLVATLARRAGPSDPAGLRAPPTRRRRCRVYGVGAPVELTSAPPRVLGGARGEVALSDPSG